MSRRHQRLGLLLLCLAMWTAIARAERPDYHLVPQAVAPDVWVLEGANADFSARNGCNIILDHLMMVDPPILQDCIWRLEGLPVLFVSLRPPHFSFDPSIDGSHIVES